MKEKSIIKVKLFIFILTFVLFFACKSDNNKPEEYNPIDIHTSESSLDWAGAYKGILPCADCEGIEIVLELNYDKTYLLQKRYLGIGDEIQIEEKGTFVWDESGQKIQLKNQKAPNQYKIGEDIIWHLDKNGEIITGDLAVYYILRKH